MSLFEILVAVIISVLVLKPADVKVLVKLAQRLNKLISNAKSEIVSYLGLNEQEDNLKIDTDITQINFYLEKISDLGEEYHGDYQITSIKSYYSKLVSQKIGSIKKKKSLEKKSK